MNFSCPQCGHQRDSKDGLPTDTCPACGVVYKKALLAKLGKKEEEPSHTEESQGFMANLIFELKSNCAGKLWYLRLPVLAFYLWVLVRKISDYQNHVIFDGINLGIHEMGHPLFSLFGRVPGIAGGTILQCLCPIGAMLVFLKQKDYFAITFAMVWLATNFIEIGIYMADATDLELNLVTIGGGGAPVPKEDMHDWHNLFGMMGLLLYDKPIGRFVSASGIGLLFFSIVLGSIFIYWMKLDPKKL